MHRLVNKKNVGIVLDYFMKKNKIWMSFNMSGNSSKVQKNVYAQKRNSEEHSRFTHTLRLCYDILLVCCPVNLCKVSKDRGKDILDRRDT